MNIDEDLRNFVQVVFITQLVINYYFSISMNIFYIERSMIDPATGGALVETHVATKSF